MQLPIPADGYVPRIFFSQNDAEKMLILTLNRHQNQLDIYLANPRSTECRVIVREQAECYVPEEMLKSFKLTSDGFVLMSERSGYKHLYLYDLNGTLRRQLTNGNFEVKAFYGYDSKNGTTYYASNQESPLRQSVYKSDSKGKMTRLSTSQTGWNSAIFSSGFRYFMNTWSDLNTPTVTTLCDASGKTLKTLEDNSALRQKLASLHLGERKFFSFTTADGIQLNGFMVLPPDFNQSKQYPVVMHQYSGPGSQQVIDSWSAGNMGGCLYEQYLAQEGFICVCVDGRGTGGRGAAFEKAINRQCGKAEMEDQMVGINWLKSLPYVDAARIGVHGWSYGGFMTISLMTTYPDTFKVGVAGGPVIDWKWYEIMYGERYMDTPQTNPEGFEGTSLINKAKNLKGKLLICQGALDDTVVWEHSLSFIQQCIDLEIPVDCFPYPTAKHNVFGRNRIHLMDKVTRYFEDYL